MAGRSRAGEGGKERDGAGERKEGGRGRSRPREGRDAREVLELEGLVTKSPWGFEKGLPDSQGG
jgi:hypothetical protein